jgi:hypothetical protein
VLPNYNTFTRLLTDAPNLDLHTYLLPVVATAPLGCAVGGTASHRAEIHESPLRATLFSEPLGVEVTSAKSFFGESNEPFNAPLGDALLSNEDLRIWVEEVALARDASPGAIGQRLRGFGTIVIPGGA